MSEYNISNLFRAGASVLEQHGWTKGQYAAAEQYADKWNPSRPWYDDATCFCALGAVVKATGEQSLDAAFVASSAYMELALEYDDMEETIEGFNDFAAKSKEEVVAHMRQVADRLEEQGM